MPVTSSDGLISERQIEMNVEERCRGSLTGTAAFDLRDEKTHRIKIKVFWDMTTYRWIILDV
jgi:hypothetical protein